MQLSENKTDIPIQAERLRKAYQVYKKPMDRLYQAMWRGKRTFYRSFLALDDVSFSVHRNETLGIIGANGSGKSTLLRMMCGILEPTAGNIRVNGRVTALLELGAGFNPEFTGRENVYLNAAIMGLSRAETDNRYEKIAAFADIGNFIDQPVKTYSSGMYIRLAFAVAVHVSPDILLIDEALSVGDLRFQQKCMARIKAFCESGTVVFVSHNMAVVTELCSRVLWIDKGRIRMDGAPKYVVEKYIEHTYGEKSQNKDPQAGQATSAGAGEPELDGFARVDDGIRQFGNRQVTIKAVKMGTRNQANQVLYAEQPCTLQILLHARGSISHPIVGYTVKDRIGRIILGENTRVLGVKPPSFEKGRDYLVTFSMDRWPNIMGGDYSLSIAVADGGREDVVQCHWLNDAIILNHIHKRPPVGIFSVPDTSVVFREL
jgi:ABC-type polysaccharide/polyol phosphate transport system ATPase subunit